MLSRLKIKIALLSLSLVLAPLTSLAMSSSDEAKNKLLEDRPKELAAKASSNNTESLGNYLDKKSCVVSGCSGELCTEAVQYDAVGDAAANELPSFGSMSPCIYLPEFQCYKIHGVCEADSQTGECGWKQTTELKECISQKRSGI